MRKVGIVPPLSGQAKKDGGVQPSSQNDKHEELPQKGGLLGGIGKPLGNRHALLKLAQIGARNLARAYPKYRRPAIVPSTVRLSELAAHVDMRFPGA